MQQKDRKAENLFQPLLYEDADFEVRSDMLLKRTRMAFRSSAAISIRAAIILFFNISVPFLTSAILGLHLYRRSQKVFITIVVKNLQKLWRKLLCSSRPGPGDKAFEAHSFFWQNQFASTLFVFSPFFPCIRNANTDLPTEPRLAINRNVPACPAGIVSTVSKSLRCIGSMERLQTSRSSTHLEGLSFNRPITSTDVCRVKERFSVD